MMDLPGDPEDAEARVGHEDGVVGQLVDAAADQCSFGDGVLAEHGADLRDERRAAGEFMREHELGDGPDAGSELVDRGREGGLQFGRGGQRQCGAVNEEDSAAFE